MSFSLTLRQDREKSLQHFLIHSDDNPEHLPEHLPEYLTDKDARFTRRSPSPSHPAMELNPLAMALTAEKMGGLGLENNPDRQLSAGADLR
jgi:hypothetical protein